MTDPHQAFLAERQHKIASYSTDTPFSELSRAWRKVSMDRRYVYNFDWMGRPIIQYPQDMLAVQELVWRIKPDLIIETGIAHGGSLILSASLLALLDISDAIEMGITMDPRKSKRKVLGIDVDIRPHNRTAIESHPMASRIQMIEGSSIAPQTVEEVRAIAKDHQRILVLLDSMHTHAHVMQELEHYAPLVSSGSYCVVFDTFVEELPMGFFANRPWNVGDNPMTAVREWLPQHPDFEIDTELEMKLQITVAPSGFLRRR